MERRIGFGWDSHLFTPGVALHLGGLKLDHTAGLAGHSDGDVLLHAITDALLGSIAAGDIGSYFPPSDPQWKGADSAVFLTRAVEELERGGYRIVNIDTTLILAAPKIGPLARRMRERIADLLGIGTDQISVKAKTPEGLNLDNVAQCHAIALVERPVEEDELKTMRAEIEDENQLENVVEGLVSSIHERAEKQVKPLYDTEDIT